MTLQEFLDNNFTHITLDTLVLSNGSTLNVPRLNVDLTIGLISTNNIEEFTKLATHYAPLGTIIEPLNETWYETKVLLVRNMLTEKLLKDQRARHYLDILERRDREHWDSNKQQKQVKVESKKQDLNITISDF